MKGIDMTIRPKNQQVNPGESVTPQDDNKPERVTVKLSNEAIKSLGFLSKDTKVIDTLFDIFEFFENFGPQHVDLLLQLPGCNQNLLLPDDYAVNIKPAPDDKVVNGFLPTLLMIGFGGSKKFGEEFLKIKTKHMKTYRKTYWMHQKSHRRLICFADLFGLNKSQTFELLIKIYFRVFGGKEEVDRRETFEMAVVIEEMMEELTLQFEKVKNQIESLRKASPSQFEHIDWSTDRMEFGESEDGFVGWDGVMNNFPVLLNHFEKYVHSNSKGLPECFLDSQGTDGSKEEGGSDGSESF